MTATRTVGRVLTAQALAGVVGCALLHAAHWRRRAHAASSIELEAAVAHQLAYLATVDTSHQGTAASFVMEAEQPYLGDRRWFYWAAATCPACRGVHTPAQGWEPTKRHAEEQVEAHHAAITDYDYVTDPDSDWPCTDPEAAARIDQADDEDDAEPA